MKYPILISFACGFLLTLSACSSVSVDDYSKNSPKLTPQEFFNGNLTAKGVVKSRSGKVTRYFTATINAHWKDGVGTLDEKFIFDDGEIQYRTWKLKPEGQTSFSGTANDVIGVGDGKFSGNAINFKYTLAVKLKDSTVNVDIDDWMWLVDENTVVNESILTKFGFRVGSIQLAMVKN
ncbi:MAG: DUF3833 domain-containing protein [Cellvibrio sp.]